MKRYLQLLSFIAAALGSSAAADIGDNAIGVNTHIPSTDVVELVADLGAQWIRVDNNWLQQGSPCTSSIEFIAPLDNAVEDAISRNIEVYMTLAYGPACASTGDADGNPGNDVPNAALYQSYVRQSVAHYRAMGVTHFGLWNEPNLDSFFAGSAQQYVSNVVVPGLAAIEDGCADAGFSDCKALGPDLAHLGDYDEYLEDVLTSLISQGLMFDVLAHHIYQSFDVTIYDGDSYINALRERRFIFTRRSLVDVLTDVGLAVAGEPMIEVWITETGRRASPATDVGEMALQEEHYMLALDEQLSLDWYTNSFFYEILDCECDIDGFGITRKDAGAYLLKPAYLSLQGRIASEPQLGGEAPEDDADAGPMEPDDPDGGSGAPDAGIGSEPAGGGVDDSGGRTGGCRAAGADSGGALLFILLLLATSRRTRYNVGA